ncbi:HAP2 [Scenedesmus sp. PABB004]|nr:HAP2 [Scenedesmus sp. PABB004]
MTVAAVEVPGLGAAGSEEGGPAAVAAALLPTLPFAEPAALEAHAQRAWAYWRALGSPKYHVAPMVDQSELPFRMLCRSHGASAAYTPMLHARLFSEQPHYRSEHFTTCPGDRPLFVQFCANDAATLIASASHVQGSADYVDLNLGCPQRIAKRGQYGAFLMDDLPRVAGIVSAAAAALEVPVSVKVRLFPRLHDTLAYARMLQAAGASLLAVHGRTREQKDAAAHRADWAAIAAVRAALAIPVLANGDVRCRADADALLAATGAEGVLSAEPLLMDPALFSPERPPQARSTPLECLALARAYLEQCVAHPTHMRMVKGHVHKLAQGWLAEFTHIRDTLNREASTLGAAGVLKLVNELSALAAATGRQHPEPKISERKLKQMEKEAARAAAIAEQEREAAALAALQQQGVAGAEAAQKEQQQEQQQAQEQQPAGQLGKQAAGACAEEPALKRQQTAPREGQGQGQEAARRALAAAIALISIRGATGVDVISSSKLETCVRNGSTPLERPSGAAEPEQRAGGVRGAGAPKLQQPPLAALASLPLLPGCRAPQVASALSCKQKLVVVVSVDSGDALASQDVEFAITCVGSYAADASCACRDLASTLVVSLTKGPLWGSYPLQYLQSFNFKPYEAIDGAWEASPTCGWYYASGKAVVDSQGFACQCDAGQIWDETFGTNTQRTRANLDCDFFADPLDILIGRKPCSAHCLMMDPHWVPPPQGYGLGEASLQFVITASLAPGGGNGSAGGEVLTLSPSTPVALSANRTLSAKLLGDLAGYVQPPVLSEKVLMIPRPRVGQSVQDVFANRSEWLLLDRSRISFDGTECDKVGTSFTAFRYQPGGCTRAPQARRARPRAARRATQQQAARRRHAAWAPTRPGAPPPARLLHQVCLGGQLKDLLAADVARVAAGRVPLYLVSQFTHGLAAGLRAAPGGPLSFALPLAGVRASLVQLEAEADSLRFVVAASPCKILGGRLPPRTRAARSRRWLTRPLPPLAHAPARCLLPLRAAARMCTFSESSCGGFEASAARGYLHALVANTGTLAAAYTLTVTNCSVNVRPVEAQRVALAAGLNGTIPPFVVYVEDDAAAPRRRCWLAMLDARGEVCDTREVPFYTNATAYEEWASGGLLGNGTGPGTLSNRSCAACSSRLDVVCAVRSGCWGRVGGFAGLLGGLVLGGGLLFLALRSGLLGSALQAAGSCLACCAGGGGRRREPRRERRGGRGSSQDWEDEAAGKGAAQRRHRRESSRHAARAGSDELTDERYAPRGRHGRDERAGAGSGSLPPRRRGSGTAPWDESTAGGGHTPGWRASRQGGKPAALFDRSGGSDDEGAQGAWWEAGGRPPQLAAARAASAPGGARPSGAHAHAHAQARQPRSAAGGAQPRSQLVELVGAAQQAAGYREARLGGWPGGPARAYDNAAFEPDGEQQQQLGPGAGGGRRSAGWPPAGPPRLPSGELQAQERLRQPGRAASTPGLAPAGTGGSPFAAAAAATAGSARAGAGASAPGGARRAGSSLTPTVARAGAALSRESLVGADAGAEALRGGQPRTGGWRGSSGDDEAEPARPPPQRPARSSSGTGRGRPPSGGFFLYVDDDGGGPPADDEGAGRGLAGRARPSQQQQLQRPAQRGPSLAPTAARPRPLPPALASGGGGPGQPASRPPQPASGSHPGGAWRPAAQPRQRPSLAAVSARAGHVRAAAAALAGGQAWPRAPGGQGALNPLFDDGEA